MSTKCLPSYENGNGVVIFTFHSASLAAFTHKYVFRSNDDSERQSDRSRHCQAGAFRVSKHGSNCTMCSFSQQLIAFRTQGGRAGGNLDCCWGRVPRDHV
ncbi:hypothetical protein Zmor_013238 [Zophobas morio]|uniref:Uncharacterized protein n=1 Tax=Zophobas morio TaxID=2755281 RepID=A0AA38MFF3_9CUCU|nr:hypothetical protein Zmor_013238 [Zophobas morio]